MKKLLTILFLIPVFCIGQTQSISIGNFDDTHYNLMSNTVNPPLPQDGTILQVVSSGLAINPRISIDSYNGFNILGPTLQFRRSGGTSTNRLPADSNYTLGSVAADGYGIDSFSNRSLGGYVIKAEKLFTNTSKPTALALFVTPVNSTTAVERLRIKPDGTPQFSKLNSVGFVRTASNGDLSTATLTRSEITTALGYTPISTTDTTPVKVTNFPATQPISAASLPLPTGASTAANQTTANTSLGNIDTDLGTAADAAVTDPTSSGSVIAILKGILQESVAQASSATRTTYTLTTNVVTTISANANRKACIISTSSGTIYVGLGTTTVSSSSYDYKLAAGGTIEIPVQAAALAIQLVSASGNTVTVNSMQ